MPGTLTVPPAKRMPRFTVAQYHRMIETGILPEGAPIELRRGLLVYKDRSARGEDPMSIGKRHVVAVDLLGELAARIRPFGCYMRFQQPVMRMPDHEPE